MFPNWENNMDLKKAAEATLDTMSAEDWHFEHVSSSSLKSPDAIDARSNLRSEPDSFEHVVWMLKGITEGYLTGEKGNRWLGWAQAVIHIHQDIPLGVFMDTNRYK